MNTAYNSTTTVQESRNRYAALLTQALERIKARKTDKTAQEPEEVTTTATEVTTTPTQQPEPVATPEEVTTEEPTATTIPTEAIKPEEVTTTRTKTASPKPLGRDIYHIFTDKYSRWPSLLDSGVYHDPNGYALLSDNQILIGSKIDYNSARSGELVKEYGTTGDGRLSDNASLLKARLTEGAVYTIDPDTITKKIKEVRDEAKYKKAREIFGDDLSISELNEELKYNKDIRREATKATKYSYVEFVLPKIGKVYTSKENIDRLVKVSKQLALSELRVQENKIQFEGDAGFVLVCVCTEGLNYRAENLFVTIDLTDAMTPTEEDATPAPEDTPAIEEATPATAPQPTPEDTTTTPEEVATQAPATDDRITVLKYCVEEYGEIAADYLDTLDYTQATEQVYTAKRGNSTKVTERFYSIDGRTIYGLHRRYGKNGKRAKFVVFKDGQIIEERTYGKNNNSYKAEVKRNDGSIRYQVEDGKVTRAEYLLTKKEIKPLSVEFDDSNRPETPRDLPAPAPSKTTKEASKPVPATEKDVPSKSRRQIIDEMRREEENKISNYILPLIAAMRKETGEQWNVPKYGVVIVTEKNIPWYFRYFNYLKTQPARDIEAIENEARKLRAQLEMRIKSDGKFLPYGAKILNIAEEYISVIIELYSAKGHNGGSISEIEMHDIIGKQIRYAIEAFDKTGDKFFGIKNMAIDFRNVANIYNNLKSEHDAKRPATTSQQPEEVKEVTTSKQEDAPYWLLLDQELQAQQEEQAEEPDNEETDDPEEVERTEEVVFLKGAELDKVIAEYSERNNLDIEYQNKRYYFYATADGYIVKLDKNKPKSRLYIADEGPYYDSYRKGEITDRTIFFEQNMDILGDYSRQRLESPVNCNVRRTITGDLSIDPFGKIEYSYDPATGKSEEIPVKHPTPRELAVYVAARDAYEADQRARLEKYWKRYSDKVSVGTYWADR